MADNSDRGPALDQMTALANAKTAELQRTIDLRNTGHSDAAMAVVLSDDGLRSMNALRLLVEQIMTDEGRLFDVRAASTKRNNALLLGLTLAGLVLIVLIGTFSIFLVQRTSRQREAARNELEATNANLERIVAHRTADLAEANEEIQRFAYIVSHDLRSPLVNIMGFTGELEALRDELFKEVGKLREQSDGRATHAEQAGQNCVPIDPLSRDFDEAIGFIKTSTTKMDRLINAA